MSSLEGIEIFCDTLTILCCDNNNISCLKPLLKLKKLSQLYCSFNNISHTKEIYSLRNLKHLKVLSLIGNPVQKGKFFSEICVEQ